MKCKNINDDIIIYLKVLYSRGLLIRKDRYFKEVVKEKFLQNIFFSFNYYGFTGRLQRL